MFKLLTYSFKNTFARKLTAGLTLLGIALVVFVFCAVLMLAYGLQKTLVETGQPDNAIIVRRSATTEVVSIVGRDQFDVARTDAAIAKSADGKSLVTGEILVLINLVKRGSDKPTNVPVRGVNGESMTLRPQVKLIEGRMWRPGTSEIIAGKQLPKSFYGAELGSKIKFGQREWEIVGIFDGGGSGFESEVWGDIDQMMAAFERPVYSSITLKLRDPSDFPALKERLESDRRLTVDVYEEKDYYRRQSSSFTTFITVLGLFVSLVFSMGAIVGAMITMYAAVANRTVEIGTLRALGFGRGAILTAFLIEAMTLAVGGGLAGIASASLLQFLEISTTNFDTFAEIAFSFAISPGIAMQALIFSIIMGIVGGFLPAVRASRMNIVTSLKAK